MLEYIHATLIQIQLLDLNHGPHNFNLKMRTAKTFLFRNRIYGFIAQRVSSFKYNLIWYGEIKRILKHIFV